MYEFKKTDSKELQKTIMIILSIVMCAVPFVNFLQQIKIINLERLEAGSIILPLGALILLLFDIYYIVKKEKKEFKTVYVILFFAVLSLVLSYIYANDRDLALSGADLHAEGLFVFLSYLIIFLSASFVTDQKNRRVLFFVLNAIGVFEVVLGVMQAVIQPPFLKETLDELYFENYKAYGTLENPNPYGSVMAMFLAIETILCICAEKKKKIVHAAFVFAYAYALFLSGTGGAIVGYMGAMFFLVVAAIVRVIVKKEHIFKKKAVSVCIVIMVVALGFVFFRLTDKAAFDNLTNRVVSDAKVQDIERVGSSRIALWKSSLENSFFSLIYTRKL